MSTPLWFDSIGFNLPSWPLSGVLIPFVAGIVTGAALTAPVAWTLNKAGLERRNFAGEPVVTATGLVVVLAGLGGLWLAWHWPGNAQVGPLVATIAAFAVLGLLDDLLGRHGGGGFRGHFRALLGGRLTTGALKAAGGGLVSLGAAWWLVQPTDAAGAGRTLLAAALIALSANLINLLDLRPLRALKVFALLGLPLALAGGAPGTALWAMLGSGLPYAPREARRRVMLGDAGANPMGAALGLAAAGALPLWAQVGAVAALTALHLYAESRSLSAWIDAHPLVARLDRWGWSAPDPIPTEQPPGQE